MKLNLPFKASLLAVVFLGLGDLAYGQSATGIWGLYYTGANNSGGLVAEGTQESHWSVTYAAVGGVESNTYQGAAYVVDNSYVTGSSWAQNTATAQWITAPGARTPGGNAGTANEGGHYLPGNGTTGSNTGVYVYTLAFNINGSGSAGTIATNQIAITLTIASDDQYQVYVNPTLNGDGSVNSGSSLGGSGLAAWDNTDAIHLQNFNDANGTNNSAFKIGVNYLTVVVNNTNGVTGNSGSNNRNASGLLVYQVGSAMTIDGVVVPEVGSWLPVVLALGLFIRKRFFGGSGAIA